MKSPRPASDWPAQIDDSEDTIKGWVRPEFFGIPLPRLPADQSIDALVGSPMSTVRAKRSPADVTTVELASVHELDATLPTTACTAPMLPPAIDVEASRRSA